MKKTRKIIGNGWFAKGSGRGKQNKPVYLINGFAYAYYPKYAREAFSPLSGELSNYIPLNAGMDTFFEVYPNEHKPIAQ